MLPANHPSGAEPLELEIAALGVSHLTLSELSAIRKQPPANFSAKLTPQLLKHSDEQTLASLVAVYEAIAQFDLAGEDFNQWGVVSASHCMGRTAFAAVMDRYQRDGAWGVSVQVIPHRTPHAVAGTISLGLGAHGPCIGVAGDLGAALTVGALLRQRRWHGAWLVFSGWFPELEIDRTGKPVSDSVCIAAALAVVHPPALRSIGQMIFDVNRSRLADNSSAESFDEASRGLFNFLVGAGGDHRRWHGMAGHSVGVDVELTFAAQSNPRPQSPVRVSS